MVHKKKLYRILTQKTKIQFFTAMKTSCVNPKPIAYHSLYFFVSYLGYLLTTYEIKWNHLPHYQFAPINHFELVVCYI